MWKTDALEMTVAVRGPERGVGARSLAFRDQLPLKPLCRGEAGLATLEWLLIVAAVASVVALAAVLVQGVVGGTAEDVASHSARQQSAVLATLELTVRWQAEIPKSPEHAAQINADYGQKCRTLGIIFGDIDLATEPAPGVYQPSNEWAPPGVSFPPFRGGFG
jgi:hypothetical protein